MPLLSRLVLCSLGLFPGMIGCGSQSAPPGVAQGTMNASESPKAPTANAAASAPTTPPEPQKPTLAPGKIVPALQLATVLDMRKLKFHKEATVGLRQAGMIYALVPGEQKPIKDYLTKQLAEQGWVPGTGPNDNQVYESGTNTNFVKEGGYALNCSISGGGEPGKTSVMLVYYGNYDARNLPHPADWPELYGSQHQVMWVTPLNVADSHAAIINSLTAAGWQEYVRPNTSRDDDAQRPTVTLRNQGYMLTCSTSAAPAQGGKTVVQITMQTIGNELPAPPEATDVEYQDSDWKLFCKIPGTIAKVSEYYDQAMIAAGHKLYIHDDEKDGQRLIRYKTPREDVVLFTLKQLEPNIVGVEGTGFPVEFLRKNPEEQENGESTQDGENPVEARKIVIRDVPIPPRTANIQFKKSEQKVLFSTLLGVAESVAAIRERLAKTEWREDEAAAKIETLGAKLRFTWNDAVLTYEVSKPGKVLTPVVITTEGVDWSEWKD